MNSFKSIRLTTSERLFPNNPEEIIRKGEVVVDYRLVTPDDAQAYLKQTNTNNRNCRITWARKLAQLQADGRWHEGTPNVIPFAYVDGSWVLLDKQHSLQAIVLSGKPQHFLIGWGFPVSAQQAIDQVAKRSVTDVIRLLAEIIPVENKNHNLVGTTAQAAWMGISAAVDRLQVEEVLDFIKHPAAKPALRFILDECVTRKVKTFTLAPVMGCFVRAYLNWSEYKDVYETKDDFKERFRQAGFILMNGPVGEDYRAKTDNAIYSLREKVRGYAQQSMGRQQRREVYVLTWKALDAFLNYRSLTRFPGPKALATVEEPYHLPASLQDNFKTELPVIKSDLVLADIVA